MPFSGGGYLRLFPMPLVKMGYRQNHAAGRPGMAYIHPREIDPAQPRLKLPWKKSFKYYVGIKGCESKLRQTLRAFKFTTVSEVLSQVRHWPEYELIEGDIRPVQSPGASPATHRAA